jgi:hypothetical protein
MDNNVIQSEIQEFGSVVESASIDKVESVEGIIINPTPQSLEPDIIRSQNEVPDKFEEQDLSEALASQASVKGTSHVNLTNFTEARTIQSKRSSTRSGHFQIVWSEKCGRRVAFKKYLLETLGYPKQIQIAYSENKLAIGPEIPGCSKYYEPKEYGNNFIIYSYPLADELKNYFNLDYSTRTCYSFSNVVFEEINGKKVAVITID